MKSIAILILQSLLVFLVLFSNALASDDYCTDRDMPKCEKGSIIMVDGENIAKYCDFTKQIVPFEAMSISRKGHLKDKDEATETHSNFNFFCVKR